MNRARASALVQSRYKWVNGTVLHYYFFDRPREHGEVVRVKNQDKWYTWVGAEPQRKVVRKAFAHWKTVGVGLEFEEVDSADEAELRIGFMEEDGSWSYLGTYNLKFGPAERTMNFGWDITVPGPDGFDTALHEVGHALGMPHEHQNPFAGIVWDERAVYDAMAEPPNEWDEDTTYNNILRKIGRTQVRGSDWDPNSIMHYAFEPGLIKEPALYHRKGLFPAGGLSRADKAWVRNFYPAIRKSDISLLEPGVSQPLAALSNGQQQNFLIKPPGTRVYEMRTFGTCDSVIVLFVRDGNSWRYQTADDDGGEDRNAALKLKLFSSKE
ncbi:MAG TPA: M12 family metallopeptidase, partial [Longimicrobiales bacterium]|nr:M12 family metallopeptidase [Longimicrobiales bacterium]